MLDVALPSSNGECGNRKVSDGCNGESSGTVVWVALAANLAIAGGKVCCRVRYW